MPKKMSSPKMNGPKLNTVDKELSAHLKEAEKHLIAAVKLFSRKTKPERHADYQKRLVRAQELVTWLLREELIRARGPLRVKVGRK